MKLKISEAGKKIAKRNANHLKAIKAAVEALMADVEDDEVEPQEAAVVFAVEEALRLADSMDGVRQKLQRAIRSKLTAEAGEERWPWVRDVFVDHCVVEVGGALYQVPYTLEGEALTLGDAAEVELAYVPKGELEVAEAATGTAPSFPVGSRVTTTGTPHMEGQGAGEVREAVLTYTYGVIFDGMEDMGIHHWYVESELQSADEDSTEASEVKKKKKSRMMPGMVMEAGHALDIGFVPLVEKAVRTDGTIALKLIDPGWGSSGYYSKEVLERDGPKVFRKGTKMFANHQTATEAMERPEGRIEDLAAVLESDARWQDAGPDGPGLYADAKVFEAWKAPINDMAADIGVSIRASGRAKHGEAEGKKGAIIEAIVDAKSVDFVTDAGRGGKILSLSEAAKGRGTGSGAGAGSDSTMQEDTNMALTEAEQKKLQDLEESNRTLQTQLSRLTEKTLVAEAKALAGQVLAGITLPEPTRLRLAESLSLQPVSKDGALDREAFTAVVREAAKNEAAYLAQVGGAGIRGMGESLEESGGDEPKPEDVEKQLAESFATLGLSESAAAIAAKGRV